MSGSTEPSPKAMEAAYEIRSEYCGHTVVMVGDDESCHICRRDSLTRDIADAIDAARLDALTEAAKIIEKENPDGGVEHIVCRYLAKRVRALIDAPSKERA